ncbi:tRNA (guanine-1-)-methyltransferase [Candidatus Filomicrobium marinum]|uniref:tRNA (guanine-N(1)-)-methyltransferase n=2 Tax=Filomicrobium TaxID=119044 RepID=A0A0D6JD13_9HYPH|nr:MULTISPECIES: tRNA (guanosine(37)-N1)-methyltransferase TrmD [Filomicrobium]MCV0370550.1 tRNA (guanosine(37)-N1)-methyltransferase TrmD [Filomicrobium sp.]CFX07897.1 tRNA (guanine-1-)-methyltransferase [Candidatus Filomicrobium marinum]CPR16697.1 tRNA (guanine-1-)-methyltransferase [Candidatus Filomicrobium marinum]SDP59134.1 tRNA (Guanine37-N(1)-) methyltransferase [Filomicrobium insigne]
MPHMPTSDGRPAWRAQILTLFPEMFPGPLGYSLTGQALDAGIWSLQCVALRQFGIGRHLAVDDRPAGGGAGMVMRADVLAAAIDEARRQAPDLPGIVLSPRGEPLRQETARELAAGPGVMLLAGRFEGIDQRVIEGRHLREISIGDFVLSGGELAAMVLMDACVRLLPGVLGAPDSLVHESFETGLLEYPQYTKPREWEGRAIPEVLVSGDHGKVDAWRRRAAEALTRERRPDLLKSLSMAKVDPEKNG